MATQEDYNRLVFSYAEQNQVEQENRLLKETVSQLKAELDRFKSTPLMVCEFLKYAEGENALIKIPNGNQFLVNIAPEVKNLHSSDNVLVEQKNLTIVKKINGSKRFNVEKFVIIDKPNITWEDIGGLQIQTQEIIEVIELPLKKPELFRRVGIQPPKGVLLYGPPGTGKTLLAKAVAASTQSTFIEIVGSELVQKFIGEGAKLVKEVFELAREKSPAIIFIDEIDALAASRIEVGTSGEREVQRTFMQFLAELDGFKPLGNIKVIGCTNRIDILDQAVLRPGRLDRLIYVPNPSKEGILDILRIHTKKMTLDKKIELKTIAEKLENLSGAEIKAVCTEAGYFAIRVERTKIIEEDFLAAIDKVKRLEKIEGKEYLKMFG